MPTFDESGLPGFVRGTWFGVLAPVETPKAIKQLIADTTRQVVESEEVKEILRKRGVIAAGGSPEAFEALIKSEIEGWSFLGKK